MIRHSFLAATLALSPVAASPLWPQSGDVGPPPKILQIDREIVRPWKSGAHAENEAGFPRVWAKANWPTHYLALTSVSGPSEAWFLTGFPSMAAVEADAKHEDAATALAAPLGQIGARDADLLSDMRAIVATYVDTLSYRANVDIPTMRYFRIVTVRVRPGHEADFAQAARRARPSHGSWMTYRVTLGMPELTYLVFIPMQSLAEMDDADVAGGQSWTTNAESGVAIESNLFAPSPGMSYVSKAFAASDCAYWRSTK